MSTQIVQLPAQAGASPVARLGLAAEAPTVSAWQVQQTRFLAGQLQFQGRFVEQHVEAGSATSGMVHQLRVGIGRIEQQLEVLVDELGAQHVELSELSDVLDGLGISQGEGRWSA